MSLLNPAKLRLTNLPELFFEKLTISYTKNNQKVNFDSVDGSENPDKTLVFTIRLYATDLIQQNKNIGAWFKSPKNNFLKFKAVFCFSEEEENLYKNSLFAISRDKNIRKTTIFSHEDFILTNQQINNETKLFKEIKTSLYKSDVPDISYLSLVFVSYYDMDEICKVYNINLDGIEEPELIFYGTPKSQSLIKDGKLEESINKKTVSQFDFEKSKTLHNNFLYNNARQGLKNKKQNDSPYLSDIFATLDSVRYPEDKQGKLKHIIKYGFFFDHKRIVEERCMFPELIKEFDEDFQKQLLETSPIKDISFRRFRIDGNSKYNNLKEVELNRADEKVSQSSLPYLENLIFFSGIDKSFDKISVGKYKYKANIKIEDGSYEVLVRIRDQLNKNLFILKEYFLKSKIPETFFKIGKDDPHIDDDIVYNFNVRHGSYILSEDRLNDSLEGEYLLKLGELINYYLRVNLLLSNSKTNITTLERIKNADFNENLKKLIGNAILPGIGNPDGILHFIDMHEKMINSLNYIFSSKTKNLINNNFQENRPFKKIQTIEYEKVFDNFIADGNRVKHFGLNFFSNLPSINAGLSEINANNITNTNDYLLKLNEVYVPFKNDSLKLDIADKLAQFDDENGNRLFSSLDNIFQSHGSDEFKKNILNHEFISDFAVVSNNVNTAVISDKNSLIQPKKPADGKSFSIINEKFNPLKKYNVDVRINIKANSATDNVQFTEDVKKENNKEYSKSIFGSLTSDLKSKFNSNFSINLASKLNVPKTTIKDNILKKIFYLTFLKDPNGNYLLKDPALKKMDKTTKQGKYLCVLLDPTEFPKIYDNLPSFNNYFIYNKTEQLVSFTPLPTIISRNNQIQRTANILPQPLIPAATFPRATLPELSIPAPRVTLPLNTINTLALNTRANLAIVQPQNSLPTSNVPNLNTQNIQPINQLSALTEKKILKQEIGQKINQLIKRSLNK